MIGPDGRMSDAAGELAGLTQAEADERVLAWLKEHGRLEKRESYRHAVGTCERCHTRIEPLISLQWWCAMDEPARPAIDGAARAASPLPPREPAPVRDPLASRRSPTGTSRGSSGGGTSCRSGTAPTDTSPAPGRRPRPVQSAARRSSSATRTCSTPGSRPRSGPSRRSAGRSGRPSSSATTRATSTRRRARSSASGRTG